jgi:hypothetical protein
MIARSSAELCMAGVTGLFGLVTVVGAVEYGIGWSSSGPEPGAFPFYIGLMVLVASIANAISALLARRAAGAEVHPFPTEKPFLTEEQFKRVTGFALPILGLVIASLLLGLYVGMALYMFGTLVFQNKYPVMKATIIALGIPIATYLLIEKAFRVGMLKGPLEAALGL